MDRPNTWKEYRAKWRSVAWGNVFSKTEVAGFIAGIASAIGSILLPPGIYAVIAAIVSIISLFFVALIALHEFGKAPFHIHSSQMEKIEDLEKENAELKEQIAPKIIIEDFENKLGAEVTLLIKNIGNEIDSECLVSLISDKYEDQEITNNLPRALITEMQQDDQNLRTRFKLSPKQPKKVMFLSYHPKDMSWIKVYLQDYPKNPSGKLDAEIEHILTVSAHGSKGDQDLHRYKVHVEDEKLIVKDITNV